MPVSSCRDASPDGRAERRCEKAIRAHSATVFKPDERGFLVEGVGEGEDVDVFVASVRTFSARLTTSVASLYRSWAVKVGVASAGAAGAALVLAVLVAGGLRVDVVLAGVFGGFGCASWGEARRACSVVVVVGEHEDGVAMALRTTSAGLVIEGILERIVAAC